MLTIDPAVASGYAVPTGCDLGAPLGSAVRRGRLLAPLNPEIRLFDVELGPMATGRIVTHVRLARSQTVTLLARRADGTVARSDAAVDVLVGGCGFDVEVEE